MKEMIVGAITLLGLLALQTGLRYWTLHRTRNAWEGAQANLQRGDLDAAVRDLENCVKLMPLWLQPRHVLGAVLARRGNLDAAEEHLKTAMSLEPRDPRGHIELGIFYVTAANRLEDGIEAFNKALSYDAKARHDLESEPRLAAFRKSEAYARLNPPTDAGCA